MELGWNGMGSKVVVWCRKSVTKGALDGRGKKVYVFRDLGSLECNAVVLCCVC